MVARTHYAALVTTALVSSLAASPALAQAQANFHLPAQALAKSLKDVARATNSNVVFDPGEMAGKRAPALNGQYSAEAAIARLIGGQSLNVKNTGSGTWVVSAVGNVLAVTADGQTAASSWERVNSNDDSQAGISEILVVGSRSQNIDIKRTEDDPQPYVVFNSEEIRRSGALNVEEFLKRKLTMNSASRSNSQIFNFVLGTTSSINLRGLGSKGTLILVNGRRLAGVNPGGFVESRPLNQPDLNAIPTSAIERIEVLPTSASAIYGGSALGGVINIILKKEFKGGSIRYSFDTPLSGSASIHTLDGTFGTTLWGGKTRIMASLHYSKESPLALKDRASIFEKNIETIKRNAPNRLFSTAAPFSGATTNIASFPTFDFSNYPACASGPSGIFGCITSPNLTLRSTGQNLGSPITFVSAGAAPSDDVSAGLLSNAGTYNLDLSPGTGVYGLKSDFGAVATTKSGILTVRQKLFGNAELFSEFSWGSNQGRALMNPFASTYTVSEFSPINPFNEAVRVAFPSDVHEFLSSNSIAKSANVGVIVPIFQKWRSEIDYTWSKSKFTSKFVTDDAAGLEGAFEAGTLNPFIDTIAHPMDLSIYMIDVSYTGNSTLNDVGWRSSGPLFSLPAGNVALTLGLGYRKEARGNAHLVLEPRAASASRNETIYFATSQSIKSIYAEALVPLIGSKQDIPGIDSLDLQIAGRLESYRVRTGTPYVSIPSLPSDPPQDVNSRVSYQSANPTFALKYKPIQDITLRASYARAFLPPTPTQLQTNLTSLCGGVPCRLVVDPLNGLAYNVDATGGGNPNLNPQRAISWNFGAILEPVAGSFQGLRFSVDHYRIRQPNFIVSDITPQQVINDPGLADRVTRDPSTGLITSVDLSVINATLYKTSGWDFTASYSREMRLGTLGLDMSGTVVAHDQRQFQVGSDLVEYVGFPGDGGAGKFKGNVSLSWQRGPWSVVWTATHFSRYNLSGIPGSPGAIRNGAPITTISDAQGSFHVPSQTYHDLYLGFDLGGIGDAHSGRGFLTGTQVEVIVQNVFNTVPPFDAAASPYYYSTYGDPRLRRLRIALKKSF